jgi:uncharacterized protein (TIGR02646 family)
MRGVDRASVTKPSCLDKDLTTEVNLVRSTGKISNSLYGHVDVSTELKSLYKEKCYLCEKDVSSSFQIEHYLPWSQDEPARAYDWVNLHLSCDKCNHRKRKKKYKIIRTGTKIVDDILVLDPSNLPSGQSINQLIKFERNRKCNGLKPNVSKVKTTVEFLNEIEPKTDRDNRWDELETFLWEKREQTILWEIIISMQEINLPEDLIERKKIIEALKFANNCYQLFLKNTAPYSKCMCDILLISKDFSQSEMKRMSKFYLELKEN